MKYLLIFLPFLSFGQVSLKIGTSGYVTIDGNNYPRGQVYSYYSYGKDTSLQITGVGLSIGGHKSTYFLDGDNSNTPFSSMSVLKTWMDANFEQSPGGIIIGGVVTGSTINSILWIGIDNTLRSDNQITFDEGAGRAYVNSDKVIVFGDLAQVAFSGDANNLLNLQPVALNNDYASLDNRPSLATVATSGSYNDLSDLPLLTSGQFTSTGAGTTTFTFTIPVGYTNVIVGLKTITSVGGAVKTATISGTTVTVTMTAIVTNLSSITGSYIIF